MENNIHYRYTDNNPAIERADGNDYIVSGYAIVFNKLSGDVGGYRERILPSALDETILNNSDIFCYLNHDENRGVLERCRFGRGGLELIIDETGLLYRFKLGDSPLCKELRYYLDRGIITKSSFSFTIKEYKWLDDEEGNPIYDVDGLQQMDVLKFERMFDVSPVFEPAYLDTSVNAHDGKTINQFFVDECRLRKSGKVVPDNYYNNIRKKYRI